MCHDYENDYYSENDKLTTVSPDTCESKQKENCEFRKLMNTKWFKSFEISQKVIIVLYWGLSRIGSQEYEDNQMQKVQRVVDKQFDECEEDHEWNEKMKQI